MSGPVIGIVRKDIASRFQNAAVGAVTKSEQELFFFDFSAIESRLRLQTGTVCKNHSRDAVKQQHLWVSAVVVDGGAPHLKGR